MNDLTSICDEIAGMIRDLKRVVVAIDGMSCAGKTTLAAAIAAHFPHTVVISMDDFRLPVRESEEEGDEPGCAVDTERFTEEVAMPLWKALAPVYRPADPATGLPGAPVPTDPSAELYIVEGTYATHPAIPDVYDLRIFVGCSPEVQAARLKECRDGEDDTRAALSAEQAYFSAFMTRELSDMCYDGDREGDEYRPMDPAPEAQAAMDELLPFRPDTQ